MIILKYTIKVWSVEKEHHLPPLKAGYSSSKRRRELMR
jgi:hypothetical protein